MRQRATDEGAAFEAALDYLRCDPWLRDPTAGEKALRLNLMFMAGSDVDENGQHIFTGDSPNDVVAFAKAGDRVAHEALCEVADHLTKASKSLPAALERYFKDATRRSFKPGKHRVSNIQRDAAIFHAIRIAIEKGRLEPTRNEASKHESACSVVTKALAECRMAMSEAEVVTIWKRRRKLRKDAGFGDPRSRWE